MLLKRARTGAPQPRQFEQGRSFTVPAPIAGLNLRDDINALEPNEALVLENWLPDDGSLQVRLGKTFHVGGMGLGEVKTLAGFSGYAAAAMLAGANASIYDATAPTYPAGNDTYTKILLQMDGTDTSTTFTDSNAGGSAHTWTAVGNAQIDTAISKFGGAAGLFDGTGDWVTTPDHADYTLGSGDFTADIWFNCTAVAGAIARIAGQCDAVPTNSTTSFRLQRNTSNTIAFIVGDGTVTTTTVTGTTQFTNALNTGWHHCAAVRTGNVLKLFIDGVQEGGDVAFTGTVHNSTEVFAVGTVGALTTTPWTGSLDEFRLSVGIARWTANFTPPTVRYAPKSMASGFTQDRWQTENYSNRLFFVNGADTPQVYDGSTVAAIAWSGAGLTNANLINVALVRNRLWFTEKDQAWAWYGGIGQITAAVALTKFQLEQIAGGGYLMAAGSWSRDGGNGADDLTVFVMSTGEIIIYQGDPASTFTLIGKFYGAPPIGRRCLFKVGGELVVITTQGFLPLSTAIGGTVTAQDIAAIDPWGKIAPGVALDAALDRANAGWHGVFHLGLVWINVPTEPGSLSKQRVLNTRTGAWTDFAGLDGSSFCSFEGSMYFGGMTGGKVMLWGGNTDDGAMIGAKAVGSFVYPGPKDRHNLYTAARPRIRCLGTLTGVVGVFTDFSVGVLTGETTSFAEVGGGAAWDEAEWDVSEWANDPNITPLWRSVTGDGHAVAVALTTSSGASGSEWYSTDVLYKRGGIR